MSVDKQLEQIANALAAPAALAERRFLAIGQSLEQAVDILGRLVALCQGLLADLQSAEMVQARHNLSAAATHIDLFAGTQQGAAVALGRLAGMTAVAGRRIAQMRGIGREVDVLAMNASLAAATMGETGADFLVFAGEIRRAAALAQANLAQIGGELTAAGEHLSAARSSVSRFAERNAEALHAIPRHLAANVAALEQRAGLAGDAASLVTGRAQDVAGQVSQAIVALQFGDITRQRIEHAQATVGILRQLLTPAADSPFADLGEARQGALLAVGCRLLGDQLLDTAETLDEAAGRVGHRLVGLAADAREIGRLGAQTHATTGADQQSFLTALQADVRQTQALFDALRAAYTDADQRTAAVLQTANRLLGHMVTIRSVEADIHIMGLNTTLKCGRLGTMGRTLGVIAQELRRCGNATAAEAGAVATELGQLVSLAGEVAGNKRTLNDATIDMVAREMVVALGHFGRAGCSLAEALASLERDSASVASLLDAAAADFAVRGEIGEVLRRSAAEAASIADQQDDPAADVAEPTGRLLALLSRDYTMAREREIHARYASGAPDGTTTVPSADAEPDLADMLF
jgi:hypothetical protein